jgi:hypothetical protein
MEEMCIKGLEAFAVGLGDFKDRQKLRNPFKTKLNTLPDCLRVACGFPTGASIVTFRIWTAFVSKVRLIGPEKEDYPTETSVRTTLMNTTGD